MCVRRPLARLQCVAHAAVGVAGVAVAAATRTAVLWWCWRLQWLGRSAWCGSLVCACVCVCACVRARESEIVGEGVRQPRRLMLDGECAVLVEFVSSACELLCA